MKEVQNNQTKGLAFEKKAEYKGEGKNVNPLQREMELMTDSQYIAERLDFQMAWYNKRATSYHKKFKLIKRWEIAIAAMIPVFIGFASMSVLDHTVLIQETATLADGSIKIIPIFNLSNLFQIIAALGGVVIIILKGIIDLEDYFKNWKEYRLTEEKLRKERFKYLTKTEPYDEFDSFPLLVETVEQILNNETQKWRLVTKKNNEATENIQALIDAQFKNKNNNANTVE